MSAPPIPCVYTHGAFYPLRRAQNIAAAHYGEGEIVRLAPVEERSEVSHRQEFAWLKDAWMSLPEDIAQDYPTVEHLRKKALIATGWCNVSDYVCGSTAEAARWAANLRREADEYTVVTVSRSVVRVFKAKSQARNAMGKEDFQASKTAIMEWVAGLLNVTVEQLSSAGQGAGGANNSARVAA